MNKPLALPLFLLILFSALPSLKSNTTSYLIADVDYGMKYCGSIESRIGIVRDEVESDLIVEKVLVAEIEGVISGWAEAYIARVLSIAEKEQAIVVLELETPGGLLEPSLSIANTISKAKVPVVTFGRGKWVESAGALILVSGHVAALAPGTITGSMQPVVIDPRGGYVPVNETKVINPIIKALCEHGVAKGRNATALINMVLANANYGAEEAMRLGVVEFTARSTEELLSKISGLKVRLYDDRIVELKPSSEPIYIPLTPSETLWKILSDPLLSGILLSIGVLALVWSIVNSNPLGMAIGLGFILIALLGYGFNASVVSLALIGLGALLFTAELLTPGFGLMGAIGVILLSIGVALAPATSGALLSQAYMTQLLLTLVIAGLVLGLLVSLLIYKAVRAQILKPAVGSIKGSMGIALEDIGPDKPGFVLVEGEYWKAVSKTRISSGAKIIVVEKKGPLLVVEPVAREETS